MRNKKFQKGMFFFLLFTLILSIGLAPMAFGEEDEDAPAKKAPPSVWSTIASGGAIGFAIILMSVAGFALSVQYFFMIQKDKLVPQDLLGHIESLFEEEDYEEVMHLCEANQTFLSNVIAATLPRAGGPAERAENAMMDAADHEAMILNQQIGKIQLISSLAPMMGLLGTVYGMILAFQAMASSEGSPSPAELADKIGLALVTTAEGLLVAIPMLVVYFFLKNRIQLITSEVVGICEELIEPLHGGE